MDDFCHAFHGGPSGTAEVKTYTFDDVVNTLNGIAPYDLRKFWTERLTNHGPGAPLTGLENSGWKLFFNEIPSDITHTLEEDREMVDSIFSPRLTLRAHGGMLD